MGQKTNAIGIRLGSRLSWRSLWHVENNNFNDVLLKDLEMRHLLHIFLKAFGLSINNVVLGSWNNHFSVFGRLVSISNFFPLKRRRFLLSKDSRTSHYSRLSKSMLHLSPFNNDTYFEFLGKNQSFFDFSKRNFLTEKFMSGFKKSRGLHIIKPSEIAKICDVTKFVIPVSSQVIADIVTHQISLSPKLKDKFFMYNLRKGIIWLVKLFFNQHRPFITGIKIICSGRWRKTKSSRKQRTTYSFGKIRRQTFSKHVDYGFSSTTTKYGVCGVKVWISYKIRQA